MYFLEERAVLLRIIQKRGRREEEGRGRKGGRMNKFRLDFYLFLPNYFFIFSPRSKGEQVGITNRNLNKCSQKCNANINKFTFLPLIKAKIR